MTLYDTKFWGAIDSARAELEGSYHYDPEADVEYNFPAKDDKKYSEAYNYCYRTMYSFFNLDNTLKEIKLIKAQIQHSQDFALQNAEFKTDFILSFSYKNWIIRINILAERFILLTNLVYRLNLPNKELANKIFEHENVIKNKSLYLSLLDIHEFLHTKILVNANIKTLKKARNGIVHVDETNFSHTTIDNLGFHLFISERSITDDQNAEDLYLEEGKASEKIKNEILDFTSNFCKKCNALYSLFAVEFTKNFKELIQTGTSNG